jgi:hypothetical protein
VLKPSACAGPRASSASSSQSGQLNIAQGQRLKSTFDARIKQAMGQFYAISGALAKPEMLTTERHDLPSEG